jgi:probable F420-dependent oxidoreductase
MMNGARTLTEAHPNRFALGVGVGHRNVAKSRGGATDESPVVSVERYLADMAAAPYAAAKPETEPARILAALGPKMLRIAATHTAGAHSYTVPVEHTAFARDVLGAGPVLAVEQKVVLSSDADAARTTARKFLPVALPNYRNNLLRFGFEIDDLADGGTDDVVDRLVAWGDPDAVRTRVREHLAAGADHVCLQILPLDRQLPMRAFRELADALIADPV